MSFISTVEADVTALWGKVEGAVETAAEDLWSLAKGLFTGVEATLASALTAEIQKFLAGGVDLGQGIEDLETAFMNTLHANESTIVADVEAVGSNLVQVLIGLALHAI